MASPLRVGVLTFHRCINYGSYWQARCLVEGLRVAFPSAVTSSSVASAGQVTVAPAGTGCCAEAGTAAIAARIRAERSIGVFLRIMVGGAVRYGPAA